MPKITRKTTPKPFTVASGKLQITDPCYSPDTWCAGSAPAQNGVFHAFNGRAVDGYWDNRSRTMLKEAEEKLLAAQKKLLNANGESMAVHAQAEVWHAEDDVRLWTKSLKDCAAGTPAYIAIIHDSVLADVLPEFTDEVPNGWTALDIDVGVDSGQAGFFDHAEYVAAMVDNSSGGNMGPISDRFYRGICAQTLQDSYDFDKGRDGLATTKFGCASLTFYGDGSYTCYAKFNQEQEIVAAFILFVSDGEDDTEDDE